MVGRGLLRLILGRYLRTEPAELQCCYGPSRKLGLAATPDGKDWHFNLSHSQGLVVIAVTRGWQIGIDTERVRPLVNVAQLCRRICSPREQAMLRALPPDEQQAAVLCCWTHKEAYNKACGSGLNQSVNEIEVVPAVGEHACRLSIDGTAQASRWLV